jgi:hypothetical protein
MAGGGVGAGVGRVTASKDHKNTEPRALDLQTETVALFVTSQLTNQQTKSLNGADSC